MRKNKGLTDENMKAKIIQFLNEKMPNSKNKEITIFFSDISEMDEDNNDVTSENLKKLIALAQQVDQPITQRNLPLA